MRVSVRRGVIERRVVSGDRLFVMPWSGEPHVVVFGDARRCPLGARSEPSRTTG